MGTSGFIHLSQGVPTGAGDPGKESMPVVAPGPSVWSFQWSASNVGHVTYFIGSSEGNAYLSARLDSTGAYRADPIVGEATLASSLAMFRIPEADLVGYATLTSSVYLQRPPAADLVGYATLASSVRVSAPPRASLLGEATISAQATSRPDWIANLTGIASIGAVLDVTRTVVNPVMSGDLVDFGNNADFILTVNGNVIDFTAVGTEHAWNVESLDVSYDGKELTFLEITRIASSTYKPEQTVTLDIAFGNDSPRRVFSGRIKQRDHVGQNNAEAIVYRAVDNLLLANDVTAVGSDGYPRIVYTVITTTTSVTSSFGTYVGSLFTNGSIPIQQFAPKPIREAVSELFTYNMSRLSAAGIPTAIGVPGLEAFTADLPESLTIEGQGFAAALQGLAEKQRGVKVLFDEYQQAWTFPNLQTVPTVTLDISSSNVLELPFSVDTSDRFTAVKLLADTTKQNGLDDYYRGNTDVVSLGGPLGFGKIDRTEVSLSPMWLREREIYWSLQTANWGDPRTIEGEDFFVYRRYSIPEGTQRPAFGFVARAYAKYSQWGSDFWSPVSGEPIWAYGIWMANAPLVAYGNPWSPGCAFPPSEVKLVYVPGQIEYTPASSVTSGGTAVYGTVATTFTNQAAFASEIRYPATGWQGTAYTDYGIEREFLQIVDPTEVTTANAKALLDVRKDAVISGEIPIDGDPILQFIYLGCKVRITHPIYSTGIESTTAFVVNYSYQFGKRGQNSISLSTDISGLLP